MLFITSHSISVMLCVLLQPTVQGKLPLISRLALDMPISTGTKWTFQCGKETEIWTIVSSKIANNEAIIEIEETSNRSTDKQVKKYLINKRGMYLISNNGEILPKKQETLFIPSHFISGGHWDYLIWKSMQWHEAGRRTIFEKKLIIASNTEYEAICIETELVVVSGALQRRSILVAMWFSKSFGIVKYRTVAGKEFELSELKIGQ